MYLVVAGQTITAAAQAANVNRSTIYRWLQDPYDQAFVRAYHRRRHELRLAMDAKLLALATKAADCLEGVVEDGDGKAALALLKGLGFLRR